MRLLLVPGMAVPLVLVACSSDDSHSLMDTALVDLGLSKEGIDERIELAAGTKFNGNERSELKFDGESFEFAFGDDSEKSSEPVKMTDVKMIDDTLADATEFNGYDITTELHTGTDKTPAGTLHAVVFARSETDDMGTPNADDDTTNHLSFGLWMVEPPEDSADEISVGAFGPHGEIGRVSVESVFQHDGGSTSNEVRAKFSGPSIGLATKDDESNIFHATVSLTAELKDTNYSLRGDVKDFKGIDMDKRIILIKSDVSGVKVVRGKTRVEGTDVSPKGDWQAGFTSANSIVGSYGFEDGGLHLIGSFGAYEDDDMSPQ